MPADEVTVLSAANALNDALEVPPRKRVLGETPDIDQGKVFIRAGSRPIALDVVDFYIRSSRATPPELQQLAMEYRLILLIHTVSVIKDPGWVSVARLGFQVRFPDTPRITVHDVIPRARFVDRLSGHLGWTFGGDLNASGKFELPPVESPIGAAIPMDLGGHASVKAGVEAALAGRISFAVASPEIQAIGSGDSFSQWEITKDSGPLEGEHVFMQILLVPETIKKKLKYDVRVSATIRSYGVLESTRRSDWLPREVTLPSGAASS